MEELTVKQAAFADYYIELGNAEQAAIKAGYSPRYARGNAHKFLKKDTIKSYIDKQLEKIASERIADAKEVMEKLTRILRREEKEIVVVTCRYRKTYYNDDGKKVIEDGEKVELIEIPAKLSDCNKAAELIGKRYGLYTDNIVLDQPSVTIINDIPRNSNRQ